MSQSPHENASRSEDAESDGARQQKPDALLKMQTLLDETQRLTKVGGWEYDAASGHITWTDEVYRIYGVDRKTYDPNDINQDIAFYAPEDQAVIAAAFHRAVADGYAYDLELRFHAANGVEKWVRTIGVTDELDGRITRVFGNITDITERKRAEEELRRSHAFVQDILDTAQTIILVLDPEGRIESFNPYMETVCGYRLAEVRGKEWITTFLPERDHARIRGVLQETLEDTLIRGNVNAIITKAGEERQIEWHCKVLKDASGQTTGVLSIGQDITEREQAQNELHDRQRQLHHLQRVQTMGEIASSLAHEINQPLAGILCNAQAAQRILENPECDLDEVRECLADVVADNRRASAVLTRVRAMLRKDVQTYAPLDINAIVTETERLTHVDLMLSGVRLHLELADGLPQVVGDRTQIEQVLFNLILNAQQAMRETRSAEHGMRKGEGKLEIAVASLQDAPEHVTVSVRDTGPGIAAK
jgi:PAS domain S-box-containing protein